MARNLYLPAPRQGLVVRDPSFAAKAAVVHAFWIEFRGDDWQPPPPPVGVVGRAAVGTRAAFGA